LSGDFGQANTHHGRQIEHRQPFALQPDLF
jgi:hypothetical protein